VRRALKALLVNVLMTGLAGVAAHIARSRSRLGWSLGCRGLLCMTDGKAAQQYRCQEQEA
jgi:hypothetical protein